MERSIVLTQLIRGSEESIELFEHWVIYFKNLGISVIEYYVPLEKIQAYQGILNRESLKGIYLAAVEQKHNNLNLSALDEAIRKEAVAITKELLLEASKQEAYAVLISSGRHPENKNDIGLVLEKLDKSIKELLKSDTKPYVYLEPCDIDVQAFQTLGETEVVLEFMKKQTPKRLQLTMDTSHIAQLNEDVKEMLNKSSKYCNHVHMANCVLKKGHPLYGDKHPFFDQQDGVFTSNDLKELYDDLENITGKLNLIVGIEIIDTHMEDNEAVKRVLEEIEWFFDL